MFTEGSSAGSRHILEYCHGLYNITSGRARAVEGLRKGRVAVQRQYVIGPERPPALRQELARECLRFGVLP